jgi:MFS family permease
MGTNIFKNRTFVLLFFTSIFAVTGFSMFLTTTTWYIIRVLETPSMLGWVLISITVPRLIMMTYGGVLADNYKKTVIMFGTNLSQAVLLAVMTTLIFNDQLNIVWLMILGGFFGMLDAFFGPASTSMIPKLFKKSAFQKANAYFQSVDQVSFIFGPVLAGLIMEVSSVSMSYLVATILVLCSAVLVFPPLIKEEPVENTVKQSPMQNLIEGFKYVRSSNFLMIGILILITLNFFIFGSLDIAMPLLVDLFGGTPINLSYMEVSLSIGMMLGTIILGNYVINKKGRTTLYGLLAATVFFLIFSFIGHLSILTLVLFFIGLSMSFVFIPFFTAAQEVTENRMTGRVMSLIFLAMNGFDPIAYGVVSGLTGAGVPVQSVLTVFGFIGLVVGLTILFKAKNFQKIES